MNPIPYARVNTLFLDVGNTLVSMNFEWIADEFTGLGIRCHPEELRRAEAAARPLVSKKLGDGSTEGHDAFRFYLRAVLDCLPEDAGVDPSRIEEISREVAAILKEPEQAGRLWSCVIPGVVTALGALRQGSIQLVAVSNSDGTVEDILIQRGLRSYLTRVYDSARVGFEKPDPRIFRHSIHELNLDPERILHVGDLYDIDVLGARAAGISAVLVDPFGDWKHVDCDRVRDLGELSQKIIAAQG